MSQPAVEHVLRSRFPVHAARAGVGFSRRDRAQVREGQVPNRRVYAAIGLTLARENNVLGLRVGTDGEKTKFWSSLLLSLISVSAKFVVGWRTMVWFATLALK